MYATCPFQIRVRPRTGVRADNSARHGRTCSRGYPNAVHVPTDHCRSDGDRADATARRWIVRGRDFRARVQVQTGRSDTKDVFYGRAHNTPPWWSYAHGYAMRGTIRARRSPGIARRWRGRTSSECVRVVTRGDRGRVFATRSLGTRVLNPNRGLQQRGPTITYLRCCRTNVSVLP